MAIRSSSAPTSKSSRCTRIIPSTPGHRWEQGDLVTFPDRMCEPDILLINGDANEPEVSQRLGMPVAAPPQPIEQPRHIIDLRRQSDVFLGAANARPQPSKIEKLHPITSEKGRKSTTVPAVSSRTGS